MRIAKWIIGLLLLAPLESYPGQYEHPQARELADALRVMQEQDTSGFVVIEAQGTDSYIQFASKSFNVADIEADGYIFDVPKISLEDAQLIRAEVYFSRVGIDVVTVDSTNPVTGESFSLVTYEKAFERHEIEAGVQLGLGFISEVLEHTGPLVVMRGWE